MIKKPIDKLIARINYEKIDVETPFEQGDIIELKATSPRRKTLYYMIGFYHNEPIKKSGHWTVLQVERVYPTSTYPFKHVKEYYELSISKSVSNIYRMKKESK